ncbi:MAG: UbiX family flavin prenyltransferase [Rikenellaceae bacterium]
MKIVVAITAASGAIYAKQILELLVADECVSQIAVVCSRSAREVAAYEGVTLPVDDKITEYNHDDMFAPPASGSASWSAMIVAPCSVGTMSRIATGVSDSLITRAADVMLKERRRLILLVRETPLSLIHLRNMVALTEAGAIVMPASPSFYGGARDVESLALTVSGRAVEMVGAVGGVVEWRGRW